MLEGFSPCEGCPAPCATACPGAALPPSGFDVAARPANLCIATAKADGGQEAKVVRSDAFRVNELEDPDKWSKLGAFLGLNVPGDYASHENRSKTR